MSLFYQTIIQYRVDIDEQGKPLAPKFLKSFTTPIYGTKKEKKSKPKELTASIGEEIEI